MGAGVCSGGMRFWRWAIVLVLVGAGCAASEPVGVERVGVGGKVARAEGGMVVTVHPLATEAGVRALREGGNAVDAAVAAAVMLGVVDGHNSGIGGGCFMLIRRADGTVLALDGREMAGSRATREMFVRSGRADTELSQTGALASGVPGSLAVYDVALRAAGRGSLGKALLPAAGVAERGFAIDGNYARKLKLTAEKIARFPETAKVLLRADGRPLEKGDRLVQMDLGRTYRAIAREGTGWFYGGEFAGRTEAWMRENGGILTAGDFAGYRVALREPVVSTYRGWTVVGFPPPSSGGVHVAQILNMLELFDVAALQRESEAKRVHVMAEAMKLAFADRAWWLGDPDFVAVPKGLTDKGYAAELAGRIDLDRATTVPSRGSPPDRGNFGAAGEKHTTHIAVADAEGNWVALTTTVNTSFGSKVIVPGTGVILNNQMDDFAIAPGVANAFGLVGNENNAVGAGKRPLSSMSPTLLVRGGKVVMTVGAAGGPKIITQVLLAISNVVDLGDDLETALARARFHEQGAKTGLWVEETMAGGTLEGLRGRGHRLEVVALSGATNAIMIGSDRMFVGVAEPRLEGRAEGVAGGRVTKRQSDRRRK